MKLKRWPSVRSVVIAWLALTALLCVLLMLWLRSLLPPEWMAPATWPYWLLGLLAVVVLPVCVLLLVGMSAGALLKRWLLASPPPAAPARADAGGLADIYVLSPSRTEAAVQQFLNALAPQREPSASAHVLPPRQGTHRVQGAGDRVLRGADEVIRAGCAEPRMAHTLYWRLHASPFRHAMVDFLPDGALVLGLSVDAHDTEAIAQAQSQLRALTGAAQALVLWEEPPPASAAAFEQALIAGR